MSREIEKAVDEILKEGFRNDFSILPIGRVNLKTGSNSLFGTIWNGWEEGKGVNYLLSDPAGNKFRVVHSSAGADIQNGSLINLVHDQGQYDMGLWQVVGRYPHTREGLIDLSRDTGRASLPFATFK